MSLPAKSMVLRAVLPNDASAKVTLALGPTGKAESRKVTLASGKMTTEAIVGRIKELSKLRDEILRVLRQLNLTRESRPSPVDQLDFRSELESANRELEDASDKYQEIQGRIEKIQGRIDDSRKKIAALEEISQTGFATDQLESDAGDFRRVLGRMPVKKLEAARRAVQSQFKGEAILAVGNKKQDSFYILVASPKDKSSPALQTLLLFDFTPIEIPEYKSSDFTSEIRTEDETVKILAKELDELRLRLDDLREKAELTVNHRLDQVVDALMLLRAILKLGEGTEASHIYARLEKVLPTDTVTNLSRQGIIELESSS
jgi:vacuolar-type H+-ATPase subunit I/STV1